MDNPLKWLFKGKQRVPLQIKVDPRSSVTSQCSSPGLSEPSSPAKRLNVDRFLGTHARPPLF